MPANMIQRVASRYIEARAGRSETLADMRDLSNWSAAGHAKYFDLPLDRNPIRYALVSDHGKFWATVRMEKGKGRGSRLFIEPEGHTVSSVEFATPYDSAREALHVMLAHASDALQKWDVSDEPADVSLWTRWFGRS